MAGFYREGLPGSHHQMGSTAKGLASSGSRSSVYGKVAGALYGVAGLFSRATLTSLEQELRRANAERRRNFFMVLSYGTEHR